MHDSIKGEISRNELLEKNVIKLRELSTTDPLTNISNRRHFFDVSENILNLSRRENINISLLMIDIDFFKKLNDAYGHQFGDIVLIKTAESIKNITRSCDVFSRMGGEEFALLLYGTPRKNALKLAEKICKTIEKTTIDNGVNRTNITVSIGVSEINKVIDTIPLLYKDADEKLYLAKESGRNCVK
jgi:diguanylate cyclase (GGDEF)-like protein